MAPLDDIPIWPLVPLALLILSLLIARLERAARRAAYGEPRPPDERVPLAREEHGRLVVEGADPYAATRALILGLTWRLGTTVSGNTAYVQVEGRYHRVTIEPTADGARYRASVPWPLAESGRPR